MQDSFFETDWLASEPIFYNEKTLKISRNINNVIDYSEIIFDPEGLCNYLDFGYAVFGQTPLKHVKILPHSTRICRRGNQLFFEKKEDPLDIALSNPPLDMTAEAVLSILETKVYEWEQSVSSNKIILPLSGGFDSRILAHFITDKSKICAFTYGIAADQKNSNEVLRAQEISKRLGMQWSQIELGKQHYYLSEWDSLYGVSTHAHGMYQLELYDKIAARGYHGHALLSGIVGDLWSGSVPFKKIASPQDVSRLAYTHGMHADSSYCLLQPASRSLLDTYFHNNHKLIKSPRYQIACTVRMKMQLLSFLMTVPKHKSFKPWSPFLDAEVAIAILSLPPEERQNRRWQQEFFARNNLDIEKDIPRANNTNYLNHHAMREIQLQPLDEAVLSELIDVQYVRRINKILQSPSLMQSILPWTYHFYHQPWLLNKVRGALIKLGWHDTIMQAYFVYLTLLPLQNILLKKYGHRPDCTVRLQKT